MRPRDLLVTIIFVTFFSVSIVLTTGCSVSLKTATQTNSTSVVINDLVKSDDLQIDAATANPTDKKSAEIQVTPPQDGHFLLENHCSQCHLTQTLEQNKKSRADWEKILEKMEKLGVQLDDAEKVMLIDYLAASDK
jgi:cytochrome c5